MIYIVATKNQWFQKWLKGPYPMRMPSYIQWYPGEIGRRAGLLAPFGVGAPLLARAGAVAIRRRCSWKMLEVWGVRVESPRLLPIEIEEKPRKWAHLEKTINYRFMPWVYPIIFIPYLNRIPPMKPPLGFSSLPATGLGCSSMRLRLPCSEALPRGPKCSRLIHL